MSKSKKVEKETRRLMESISDLVKKKGDHYKFKTKKKKILKKVKRSCVHWIYHKNKEIPTLVADPNHPGNWKCLICGASFPMVPLRPTEKDPEPYKTEVDKMLGYVNQMQFYSVKLGGDAEDTKMFLELKKLLPKFRKASKQIVKRVEQRNKYEESKAKGSATSQFDVFAGFNYRP